MQIKVYNNEPGANGDGFLQNMLSKLIWASRAGERLIGRSPSTSHFLYGSKLF